MLRNIKCIQFLDIDIVSVIHFKYCLVLKYILLQSRMKSILLQSRNDPYRILRYDLATAGFNNETPLLLRRHNVAPGMFLVTI